MESTKNGTQIVPMVESPKSVTEERRLSEIDCEVRKNKHDPTDQNILSEYKGFDVKIDDFSDINPMNPKAKIKILLMMLRLINHTNGN